MRKLMVVALLGCAHAFQPVPWAGRRPLSAPRRTRTFAEQVVSPPLPPPPPPTTKDHILRSTASQVKKAWSHARRRHQEAKGRPPKVQRFTVDAKRSAAVEVPLFAGTNATLDLYMAQHLESFDIVSPSHLTRTPGGFRLALPLGSLLPTSADPLLDGLSLRCDVTVHHDPLKRRNVLTARSLSFAVDPLKAAADASQRAADDAALRRTWALARARLIERDDGERNATGPSAATTAATGGGSEPGAPSSVRSEDGDAAGEPQAALSPLLLRLLRRLVCEAAVECKGSVVLEWGPPGRGRPSLGAVADKVAERAADALVANMWASVTGGGRGAKAPAAGLRGVRDQQASVALRGRLGSQPGKSGDHGRQGGSSADATAPLQRPPSAAAPAPTVPLRFRTEGSMSFAGRGVAAWVPVGPVNAAGSLVTGQLLRALAPRLLAAVALDYGRWAIGAPRDYAAVLRGSFTVDRPLTGSATGA